LFSSTSTITRRRRRGSGTIESERENFTLLKCVLSNNKTRNSRDSNSWKKLSPKKLHKRVGCQKLSWIDFFSMTCYYYVLKWWFDDALNLEPHSHQHAWREKTTLNITLLMMMVWKSQIIILGNFRIFFTSIMKNIRQQWNLLEIHYKKIINQFSSAQFNLSLSIRKIF
jgi:hypothetical protein